jgi:hypothetical protein
VPQLAARLRVFGVLPGDAAVGDAYDGPLVERSRLPRGTASKPAN